MMIFKKAIPRRTFLRGAGATLALPLLDGMVPAMAALRDTAAKPAARLSVVYVPNGMIMEKMDAGDRRGRFRVDSDYGAAGSIPGPSAGAERARPQQRSRTAGRKHGRPCARRRHLPDGRSSEEDGRRRHPGRNFSRSDCRQTTRQAHPTGVARTRPGYHRAVRPVRSRLYLRLHEYPLLAHSHDADADGKPPARGIRNASSATVTARTRPYGSAESRGTAAFSTR